MKFQQLFFYLLALFLLVANVEAQDKGSDKLTKAPSKGGLMKKSKVSGPKMPKKEKKEKLVKKSKVPKVPKVAKKTKAPTNAPTNVRRRRTSHLK
mmetsp:Transcript_27637/g.60850  ORF Transcript_27637/g.60850 Transcript_27637/m.60850 type:complete len:95 (+) Transcript_27637:262-546(+)|eukprot:CAMPEP_0168192092 /NCGR_PEP_ID=MMETSP0139_2-20121125/17861_1 /TAXON_ID=44445 /ORGANISM="Pseudo-nitzschia australis, Strain 10249 10 AB" /LENGTH=94 /DNA_ID=CAMNT_0008115303 /DNA_START=174 /DNA_END=458 /DNA_ORIENTATION=-